MEARVLMMSTNNILSPAFGKPVINPTQDIVLGLYYMTRSREFAQGEGKLFSSPEEVRMAYEGGVAALQAQVKCRIQGEIHSTTVGRCLLTEIVPDSIPFDDYNRTLGKKEIGNLIDTCFRQAGTKDTVLLADALRTWGFDYSTRSGSSISIEDLRIPDAPLDRLRRRSLRKRRARRGEGPRQSGSSLLLPDLVFADAAIREGVGVGLGASAEARAIGRPNAPDRFGDQANLKRTPTSARQTRQRRRRRRPGHPRRDS